MIHNISRQTSVTNDKFVGDEFIGQMIGSYRIEAVLGQGGMSVVYRARTPTDELMALKILFPPPGTGPETLARFEREARTAARLKHPALVPVFETGQVKGRAFMAMALVEGETLTQRLAREGQLDEATAADIAWQIADALYYAHGQGVVHRDIKPSNILLTETGQARLTDFGVAQALDDPALTRTGFTVGTPAYMSPEQAAGDQTVDGRSDLYSLGVVLYQMVTGRLPFQGGTPQMLHAHVYKPPPSPSAAGDVSAGMETVILRALAKDRSDRFQTGAALAQALNNLDDHTNLNVPAPAVAAQPWWRNLRVWITLLTLSAIGIAFWELAGVADSGPVDPITLLSEPATLPATRSSPATPTPTVTRSPPPTATGNRLATSSPAGLPFPVGSLLKGSGDGVFRMQTDGNLQHIYDWPTFLSFGFTDDMIQTVDDSTLANIPTAGELTRLLENSDQSLDWVVNGERWRIGRWQASLAESGYLGLLPSPADEHLLNLLPLVIEQETLPEGRNYKEGNNIYHLFANSELRRFPDEALVTAYGYDLEAIVEIPSEIRHLYRSGPPLTPLLQTGDSEDIFLIVEGRRRLMPTGDDLFALGYGIEDIGRVSSEFLAGFPLEESLEAPSLTPNLTTEAVTPDEVVEIPPTPTPCPLAVDETFSRLTTQGLTETLSLGCPRAEGFTTSAAWQPFEQGLLLWRGDRNLIYILLGDNNWSLTGDTWEEGDDPFDPAIIPPPDLFQPQRGFGKVWREQPGLRSTLGWALTQEEGFTAIIQEFENSEVWYNEQSQTFYLLADDDTYQLVADDGLEE